MPKCPSCGKPFNHAHIEPIETRQGMAFEPGLKAVAFCCPLCKTAISVELDPLVNIEHIALAVKKALGR